MGFLFSPLSFSPAEISAMRLDGDVTPEGMFLDAPDDWRTRLTRVLWGNQVNIVLTGLSAAWALGSTWMPHIHTVTGLPGHGPSLSPRMNFRAEERTLAETDVWLHHCYGVTTPLRTVCDLLRTPTMSSDLRSRVCLEVMTVQHLSTAEVRDSILAMRFVPYSRQALQRVEELETFYPSETRYTS